ncbi:MAG: polyprenyl synthetase family protein, partial [Candidatus Stahlbacteria bacterium]|nr:polyprenyl synthetase family protein [Candidatus Stahlbacteria bacterium]
YEVIADELQLVETALARETSSDFPFASDILELLDSGKRLRPALLLISYKTLQNLPTPNPQPLRCTSIPVNLAVGIELLHIATLIHDDIVDDGTLRRGVSTLNAKHGSGLSVLMGDHLYSKSISLFVANGNMEALTTIAHTATQMIQGELTERLSNGNMNLSESEYLDIIRNKTASLFSACCKIGALVGEASNSYLVSQRLISLRLKSLTDYGTYLGIAFQITDDLLDVCGTANNLGKYTGSDLKEQKMTLPLIYAFRNSTLSEQNELKLGFQTQNIELLRPIFDKYKAIEYSVGIASEYVVKAQNSLTALKDSEFKTALLSLADYVIDRNS